jgi:hypothetical protein
MKTSGSSATFSVSLLRIYYAATLLFVILDYFLNINVRLAFLDAWPQMRVFYYLLCFACLGLIIWRPAWSLWIGTIESMLSLSLLIVTMGVRVMTMSEQLLRTGTGLITMSEIMNFMIVGGVAWVAYMRGVHAVKRESGLKY